MPKRITIDEPIPESLEDEIHEEMQKLMLYQNPDRHAAAVVRPHC